MYETLLEIDKDIRVFGIILAMIFFAGFGLYCIGYMIYKIVIKIKRLWK